MQLLRVNNLTDRLQGDPVELLEGLARLEDQEPSADKVYALSELAYLWGARPSRTIGPRPSTSTARRCCTPTITCSTTAWRRRGTATIRSSAAPATCTTARLEAALADDLQAHGELRARHDQDHPHGRRRLGHHLRAARRPLAARGLRPLRVRLRLRDQGAEEPLPDARPGRAADRRPRRSYPGRAGRRTLLSAGPEFPGHGLPAAAAGGPIAAAPHQPGRCWSCTIRWTSTTRAWPTCRCRWKAT